MSDWQLHRFKDLLVEPVRNGIYKTKEFHGSGAKVVNMGELFGHPRLFDIPMKRVDLNDKEISRFNLCSGDLIFARRSLTAEGAGKCSIVMEVTEPTAFESSIIRARPDPNKACSKFLYYFFSSPVGQYSLGTIRRQVAVAGITGSDLALLEIRIPNLPAQSRVAAIFTALDDKIELNRRMNEVLEAQAQTLFRDWFVDFGPVRAKAKAKASGPDGSIPYLAPDLWSLFPDRIGDDGLPEGWLLEPLIDQASWINGAAYKNMHFVEQASGLPVIKIAELKAGVTGNTKFTNTDLGQKYLIQDDELLFSWSGNPDTSIDAFLWAGGQAWLNQHIFAVRANGKRDKAALFVLLKYLMPQFAEIARDKQTTGLGHVTKADMARLMVVRPCHDVKLAFDEFVTPIVDRILTNQKEARSLAQTRDLLLPKLMSGEIRVGEAEKKLENVL